MCSVGICVSLPSDVEGTGGASVKKASIIAWRRYSTSKISGRLTGRRTAFLARTIVAAAAKGNAETPRYFCAWTTTAAHLGSSPIVIWE
ncbi:hypothetical protein A0H81_05283 [Grifola frondosa]|uniref:Uncharacterized protein n=1 Tax=Grifola frondosa TaxID=5627 RepID=A0A1C7MCJ1_GRIFR|nr:hypothetical protein A0H81_05283 [Grifola frondosa]